MIDPQVYLHTHNSSDVNAWEPVLAMSDMEHHGAVQANLALGEGFILLHLKNHELWSNGETKSDFWPQFSTPYKPQTVIGFSSTMYGSCENWR